MKKGLFLLFLAVPCFGEGPLFRHKDPIVNREVQNIYQDLRDISVSTSTYIFNQSTRQDGAVMNISSATIDIVRSSQSFIGNIPSIPADRNSRIIFDDFDVADRAMSGRRAPTGQVWSLSGTGAATATITSGMYTSTANTYAALDYGSEVFNISGAFSFHLKPTGNNDRTTSTLAMILDEDEIGLSDVAHLIISPNGWTLQKNVGGGGFTSVMTGTHQLNSSGTVYGMGLEISGSSVTVIQTNGIRKTVPDTDLQNMTLRYGIWQIATNANGLDGRWQAVVLGDTNAEKIKALGFAYTPKGIYGSTIVVPFTR